MKDNTKKILLAVYVLLLVPVTAAFVLKRQIWAVDSAFMGFLLYLVYRARRALNITGFLFVLLSSLVLLHCFAVFGMFRMTILGFEYDTYIHFYSGIVVGMVVFNYTGKYRVSLAESVIMAFFIALGAGLLNELIEFAGYKLFGEGEGLFMLGPGDIGATNAFENLMTDFFNDFYGNLSGIIAAVVYRLRKGEKKTQL